MSGIEVAGLAIGIVPIVVEILKSYRITKDRLRSFVRYSQVAFDVQLRYRVAATNFSNDCQLLLKAVVSDARELSEMIEDPNHDHWHDSSLEERFRNFLERDYQLCEDIIVRIRDLLRETQAKLAKLDQEFLTQNESQQAIMRRLCLAFNVSSKENQYYRWLDDLDQWNTKLAELRTRRCKLQKRRNPPSESLIRKALPRKFCEVHTASQRLHESLQESWSCSNVSHTGHQAKLSLDAKAEYGTARLDLVIACRRRSQGRTNIPPSEPPIWLHVQSNTTTASLPRQNLSLPTIVANSLCTSMSTPKPSANDSSSRSIVATAKRKSKRVRFHDVSASDEDPANQRSKTHKLSEKSTSSASQSFAMVNLKATRSICCHLSKACSPTSTCTDTCLGYLEILENPNSFRLMFYDASKNAEARTSQHSSVKASVAISGLLQSLQTLHQLTLAHKLATAILQYHSTSWLPQDWNLDDVAYFNDTKSPEDDISKTLHSLHLSTQFPCEASTALTLTDQDPEHLKYMYGIRNLTLAKLGVALIEIAFRKDIGSCRPDPTPHDVIKARQILLKGPIQLARLGKRYTTIARKCIDCDFSCGDNLDEASLQSAVYTDIVCALEDMIRDWKKFLE